MTHKRSLNEKCKYKILESREILFQYNMKMKMVNLLNISTINLLSAALIKKKKKEVPAFKNFKILQHAHQDYSKWC